MNKARKYLRELNTLDEHVKIEAKQCSRKLDKSVLETVCSFSNEPDLDGGIILIGITADSTAPDIYTATGVESADKMQQDLATQCATMFNHPIRPFIEIENIGGKNVLVVTVPELDP